jgi:hypothetical protein
VRTGTALDTYGKNIIPQNTFLVKYQKGKFMEAIFSGICIGLVIWILKKAREQYFPHSLPSDETNVDFDFEQVREVYSQMGKTIQELESIEQLLTELELTEPEVREKPLEMSWSDAVTGKQNSFRFWMDGRKSTQLMIETVYEERDQLRSSLFQQIDEMHSTVVTKAVTKAYPNSNREGVKAHG